MLALLSAFLCVLSMSACSESTSTGISSLKLVASSGHVELDAGDSAKGYFKVDGKKDFSIDDIEFVSSDPAVATFVYDETVLDTCVYYKINALSAGTATVYAQTKDGRAKTNEITVTVSGYICKVAEFEDTSTSSAERMTLRVTASEDYLYAMSDEQLSDMVKFIASNYTRSHKINAVVVYLYCDGDDTNGAFTIACCTYAPYGDISKALDVTAGDYSSFDYNVYVNSASERGLYRKAE